ncbi:MAG TPA: uracil-DNA glycosylase [Candidatus Rifleibacterium sp.]|nr:uracil-DNA glycosylase [Candidatus Rifleibacterium sp.]HPW57496.1 uracil-DNA glycosylase [Candidatus Rifleibacterium sp.]
MNCRECQYFFVTWQVSAPYGCKAHGFKSAQLPSMVVFSSSGQHCLLFRQRVHQAK